MSRLWWAALALVSLAACGGGASADQRVVTVFASVSLTEVFDELEAPFEDAHPGVDLQFSFAGSSDLATQIRNGAPADVFASADEAQMQLVVDDGLVDGDPRPFATNRLTIAVPDGNPAGIESLTDLADRSLVLVACAPQVPCGGVAQRVAADAGVDLRPDSEEPDVRSVLAKVQAGEADAGLTWVTDVAATDGVEAVDIGDGDAVHTVYPIAVLAPAGGPSDDVAAAFVDFVLGPEGQRVLAAAGFAPAP